ncbi:YhcG family protein [Chryseobacterium sp. SN22]|uniref:PDDEXK nuclease domain-containing protein n=1 Tax=Chryseobacterium sp. SN22 TaxID=2606431 RepID=UPI0029391681|nr:PDDEXK nuclease domain-containing protein [Chryseobacterium sp. SN22]
MAKKIKNTESAEKQIIIPDGKLFTDISLLIKQSRHQIAMQANSTLTLLFWKVGKRINDEILQNQRAEYGKQIVTTLSSQLENLYGRNFTEKNVRRMMQFAGLFPDEKIVVTLSRQLSWSHFLILIPLKSAEAQRFYAQLAIKETMSVRDLRKQIANKTFERTEIANIQATDNADFPVNTFKDPYLLDFLGLQAGYLEKDIETAILGELEKFILELGKGFAFVERQKRMIIEGEDFYLDLLFYHRSLRRLVAAELKLGKFQARHKGQMELYLKWLDKNERKEGEETTNRINSLCRKQQRTGRTSGNA